MNINMNFKIDDSHVPATDLQYVSDLLAEYLGVELVS